jgi:hypothetical protein
VALIAIFLGTAALVLAIALPTVLVPGLKKVPSNVKISVTMNADNARLVDVQPLVHGEAVHTSSGVDLQIHADIHSIPPTGDNDVTLSAATRMSKLSPNTPPELVIAYVDQVTIDRRTAEPLGGTPAKTVYNIGESAQPKARKGFQYTFPIGLAKHSYPYYDVNSRTEGTARYLDDNRTVDGMRLYHFRVDVPRTNLAPIAGNDGRLSLAAKAWGLPGNGNVTFDRYYSSTIDLWVEPRSGVLVVQDLTMRRELVGSGRTFTEIDASFHMAPDTIAQTAALAKKNKRMLDWGEMYAPITLGVLGGLLLVTGVAVLIHDRRRRPTTQGPDDLVPVGLGEGLVDVKVPDLVDQVV